MFVVGSQACQFAASMPAANYFLTLIVFRAPVPPALEEVTWKVSLTLPGFLNLSSSLTVFDLPAAIFPTPLSALIPMPFAWSLTPVASMLPKLETRILFVVFLALLALKHAWSPRPDSTPRVKPDLKSYS